MAGNTVYADLPAHAFWKTGVASVAPDDLRDLWQPRHPLRPGDRIASLGSCFAQHLAAPLRAAGLNVIDAEPPPPGLTGAAAQAFGYRLFSARTGNIYTARQLRDLLRDAGDDHVAATVAWRLGDRWVDGLRPGIEPEGLPSVADVQAHRHHHLARVRQMCAAADVLVFTLGLAEGWHDAEGRAFPTAAGVIATPAGDAPLTLYRADVDEVVADLEGVIALLRGFNPAARLLLTVSPVPLTATAGGDHVLVASTLAKAILRAAADTVRRRHDHVDYFPSYEIIMNPAALGRWFAPNLRQVRPEGVAVVMRTFLAAQGLDPLAAGMVAANGAKDEAEVVCDEALAEAFAR